MTKIYTFENTADFFEWRKHRSIIANKLAIIAEEYNLANSWKFEVYLEQEDNKFTVITSSPMTKNSESRDPTCVGEIDYFSLSDFEGVQYLYTKNGERTEYLIFSDGEFDQDTYNEACERYGKDNLHFAYYQFDDEEEAEPALMHTEEYLEYLVDNEDLTDIENIMKNIEEKIYPEIKRRDMD